MPEHLTAETLCDRISREMLRHGIDWNDGDPRCYCGGPLPESWDQHLAEALAGVFAPELAELATRAEQAETEARAAIERAQEVYHEFFSDGLKRDEFTRRLRGELFEALHGQPRSDAVWLDEVSPVQHRAESPHHPCGREEAHEGHAWRGCRREFSSTTEVTRTYWCEGAPALDAPQRPEDTTAGTT